MDQGRGHSEPGMTFISYAQNFEDVVLWRALRSVNSGFYIDVGAADPSEISVTKAFYDRGWSGINIEPTAAYFERLVQERSRDLNLNLAAGAAPGLMVLNQISGTGLSTGDGEVARRHADAGWQSLETTVPRLTLASICELQDITEIHFLKVDVEGAEADVLRGMDFGRFRPWIVVVEATEPLSPARVDASYEDLLLGHGYRRAYFDGLNVFYVADEHAELAELLATPPNVFDDYITFREHGLDVQVGAQAGLIHTLSQQVKGQDEELIALRLATAELQAAKDDAETLAASLRRDLGEALATMRQELDEAKATVQRVSLHADQLKRRLTASYEDAAQHQEAGRLLRLELDMTLQERDALLAERDTWMTERETMRLECRTVLAERDALLLERDAALASRDKQSGQLQALHAATAHLTQEQHRLHTAHATVTSLLDAVRVSTSWRLTRPVRVIGRAVKAGLQRPGT